MKQFWTVLGVVFVVGCTTQTPVRLDDATRPLERSDVRAPALMPAAPATQKATPTSACLFDAECPKGHRCQAPRPPMAEVGTCTAMVDTPHS